jgi:DNA (cytosine-5)-methyltransferase 1
MAAGFPCQPFSAAGVSKKISLGREHGFRCLSQGTLFFTLASIVAIKRPPVLLLENVKNLKSHDCGRTWEIIHGTLRDLRYSVFARVIDAAAWVPQHRERVFIVCFDENVFGKGVPFDWDHVTPPRGPAPKLSDILDPKVPARYTLTDHLWNYLQEYAAKHKARGNGFGYGIADPDGITRTLSARYYKDGSEILVPQGRRRNPRRLTPAEAARLMGFSGKFAHSHGFADGNLPIVVSDTQAYRQFGNSVCPLVVEEVAKEIVSVLRWQLESHNGGCVLKKPSRRSKIRA